MRLLGRLLLGAAAILVAAAALRRFRRFADPDPAVYGHPSIQRDPGP